MPICDTCDDFLENTECPLFIIYVHCLIYHVHNIMFILWLYYGYIINIFIYIYMFMIVYVEIIYVLYLCILRKMPTQYQLQPPWKTHWALKCWGLFPVEDFLPKLSS